MGLLGDSFKAMRMKDPKLRDSGALSDQEFEREKARILGQ